MAGDFWAVVEKTNDFDEVVEIHVVPEIGRQHAMSPRCWCSPRMDEDTASYEVHSWVHEMSQ